MKRIVGRAIILEKLYRALPPICLVDPYLSVHYESVMITFWMRSSVHIGLLVLNYGPSKFVWGRVHRYSFSEEQNEDVVLP